MPNNEVFTKRLREARLRAGLSQMALGIAAGIDEFSASPRINQYEKGKHLPDLLTISRIAEVLNAPTPYFFAEDDDLADLLILWNQLKTPAQRKLLALARDIDQTD